MEETVRGRRGKRGNINVGRNLPSSRFRIEGVMSQEKSVTFVRQYLLYRDPRSVSFPFLLDDDDPKDFSLTFIRVD